MKLAFSLANMSNSDQVGGGQSPHMPVPTGSKFIIVRQGSDPFKNSLTIRQAPLTARAGKMRMVLRELRATVTHPTNAPPMDFMKLMSRIELPQLSREEIVADSAFGAYGEELAKFETFCDDLDEFIGEVESDGYTKLAQNLQGTRDRALPYAESQCKLDYIMAKGVQFVLAEGAKAEEARKSKRIEELEQKIEEMKREHEEVKKEIEEFTRQKEEVKRGNEGVKKEIEVLEANIDIVS